MIRLHYFYFQTFHYQVLAQPQLLVNDETQTPRLPVGFFLY